MELKNKVMIGADYLQKKVRQQYANHMVAMIREFLQNSLDAGATEVHFTFNKAERLLSVWDNGCGMDDFIMTNYLFQLGGSMKDANKPHVGGFGAAKLILLFQHESFHIETNKDGFHYLVHGSADLYSDIEKTPLEAKSNTNIVIKMLPSWSINDYGEDRIDNFEKEALQFLSSCSFNAKVTWNGQTVQPYAEGKLFKTLDWCKVCYRDLPEGETTYIKVRVNGLLMFKSYYLLPKDVTIELTYDNLKVLTENRDGLKNPWAQYLHELQQEFVINKKSFTRMQGKIFYYQGRHTIFNINQREEADLAEQPNDNDGVVVAAKSSEGFQDMGASQLTCGFVVKVDKGLTRLKSNMDPLKGLSPKYERLAKLWMWSVRYILDKTNQSGTSFDIGWVFSDQSEAMYYHKKFYRAFLINPELEKWWNAEHKIDNLMKIFMTAAHEVAHVYEHYHDECFVQRYDKNLETMFAIRSWKGFEADAMAQAL